MDPLMSLDTRTFDVMDPAFHGNLLASLAELSEHLQEMTNNAESRSNTDQEDINYLGGGVLEVMDSYNYAMGGLHTFLNSLDTELTVLDKELESLKAERCALLEERDILIEKGHELNCRIGYNALERKLDETFSSLEKYTSEDSAKCFRDEAEENLRRTNDLIRVANMTSCQIDRDMFKEMEKITNLFENYERDREYYVKELDLFSDVRRQKISAWLAGACSEEERERGENLLDYLNLSQRQRHMEAQVIKNALRMYSFNASLNFDREDNVKLMEELMTLQNKANSLSGVTVILPRTAKAKISLIPEKGYEKQQEENARGGGDCEAVEEMTGKGLHRCSKKINLATDPITDPELVAQLESALRWDEKEERSVQSTTYQLSDSISEPHEQTLVISPCGSSSSETMAVKTVDSVCGDADVCVTQMVPPVMEITPADDHEGSPTKVKSESKQIISHSTHTILRHIESPTVLPGSAERQIVGLVRKRHSGRAVGSLTNVADTEDQSGQRLSAASIHERETRSQGSESSTRPAACGNRSRENVPNMASGCDKDL